MFVLSTTLDKLHRGSAFAPVCHLYEDCMRIEGRRLPSTATKLVFPERFLEVGMHLNGKTIHLCRDCEKRRKKRHGIKSTQATAVG